MKEYYLHISSKSLANYFGSGAIVPHDYSKKMPDDLQSKFPSHLMLSLSVFSKTENCSVGLKISEKEIRSFKRLSNEYMLLEQWLPISRVMSVNFKDKALKTQAVYDVNKGDGFIPSSSVFLHNVEGVDIDFKPTTLKSEHNESITTNLAFYNSILGAISFSSIARRLTPSSKVNSSSISLSLYSYFSPLIRSAFSNQGGVIEEKFNSFLSINNQHVDLKELIHSDLSSDKINKKFKETHGIDLPRKFGSVKLDDLDHNSHLYGIVVASDYGVSGSKKDQDLVTDVSSGKIKHKLDGISFVYGLHKGYTSLRNSYHSDKNQIDVKFRLDTIFDRILIEDIYSTITKNESLAQDFSSSTTVFNAIRKPSGYISYSLIDKLFIIDKVDYSKGLDQLISLIFEELSSWFNSKYISIVSTKASSAIMDASKSLYKSLIDAIRDEYETEISLLEKDNRALRLKLTELQNQNNKLTALQINKIEDNSTIIEELSGEKLELIDKQIVSSSDKKETGNNLDKNDDLSSTHNIELEITNSPTLFDEEAKDKVPKNQKVKVDTSWLKLTNSDRLMYLKKVKKPDLRELCKKYNLRMNSKANKETLISALLEINIK